MTTAKKLMLGFGTLTVLLVLICAILLVRLRAIEQNAEIQANVASPRTDATRELAINILEYGLAIRIFLQSENPRFRQAALDHAVLVERQLAEYERLARTDRQRELAARCAADWQNFQQQGQALSASRDNPPRPEDLAKFTELRHAMENLLQDELKSDAVEAFHSLEKRNLQQIRTIFDLLVALLISGGALAVLTSVAVGRGIVQAERLLQEREAQYRALFEQAIVGVARTDVHGRFLAVNAHFCQVLGYRLEELLRLRLQDVTHPEDLPLCQSQLEALAAGGPGFTSEMRSCHKAGSIVWVVHSVHGIRDAAGNVTSAATVALDITERKRMEARLQQWNEALELQIAERTLALRGGEERLRAILTTAADAIITIDRQGIIQTVNPATERLFGYTPEEMVGRNVALLMPFPYRQEHDGYIERYLKTRVPHIIGIGREALGQHQDGTVFPIDLSVSEVGHLGLFTGIVRDITLRKQLEREVVEIASLEQRRIGQDLHDTVGQELTALNMLASDLAETVAANVPGGTQLVGRIVEGLRRSQRELRAVMRGLLPVSVDTEGLMAALADLAERTHQEGKAACVFDCPQPVFVANNLTATHLYLIAQEAVHNAVKHAAPCNIRIALEARRHLMLRVQDDGVGKPPASAGKKDGLGLRIMRNRAAIISATLTIEPAQPTGTVVTCVLPRKCDGT